MNYITQVVKITWDEYLQYRLNFILWRVRNFIRLLVVYFLWLVIFDNTSQVFGYNQSQILTYILATLVVSGLVFSTKTQDIGQEIIQGDLSNLLLKPVSVFKYWIAREIGDKLLNLLFAILEIVLLLILLKPVFFWQTDLVTWIATIFALIVALCLYFLVSLNLSFIAFISSDVWGPRFLFFMLLEFFAGGLFPLDILPTVIYKALQLLPFSYMLYFPIKSYLGQLTFSATITGLSIGLLWLVILSLVTIRNWKKGLLSYAAYGR